MNTSRSRWRWRPAVALTATLAVLTGCGGGASDVPGDRSGNAATTLTLVAYAVPEPGWSVIIPAFTATPDGADVGVTTSYGASGDQSRSVVDGKNADIVNFSVEPDITRLVKAGKVAADWDSGVTHGIPFGSVVALVVRPGNPKNIHSWDDLLAPGIEVVTPSPLSSGSAKWNLLAPYAAKSAGGADPAAGLAYINELVNGHVRTRPGSGREATDVFLRGTGDVLISYENEAINTKRRGDAIDYVVPADTFKIDNPVAVTSNSAHQKQAVALNNFLYTTAGQRLWAQSGFRPVDPAVAAEFADDFPAPAKLWTIADPGGWKVVDSALFDKENGSITAIYKKATG
ncbi:sulfate ABC transporter substrate-binding protein [Mycolicibacterium insubricum]|uniref:sulfate ABC transporter substrate-binding protein n=1 Tax=Mycolicibacterium insubricum TaxID=444597 RepID=UPI0021F285B5|nr:sulfate ABC transporter substrate-binding protein [Mycolicibacterium insubricum]MCV7082827.1 sulfate ABC transporter substrate-binding protein [Mycolicibacterium insubricum]